MRTEVRVVSVPEYEAGSSVRPPTSRKRRTSSRRRSPSAARRGPGPARPTCKRRQGLSSERARSRRSDPSFRHRRRPRPRPRWLELATSSDHKDVGRMMIAAALALPGAGPARVPADPGPARRSRERLDRPVTFNRLLSVMGASLVVLFALPLALGLYTYLVPLQVGARSLAFPRLANLSFWLYVIGGAILYVSFVYPAGGASTRCRRCRTRPSSPTTGSTSGSPRWG